MRSASFVVLIAAALCFAHVSDAQPREPANDSSLAAARFRLALDEFRAGHFAQAAVDFEAAYETTHDPSLLFNVASARYEAGDLPAAEHAFAEYLRLVPDAPNRPIVEARLVVIRQRLPQASAAPSEASAAPMHGVAPASVAPAGATTTAPGPSAAHGPPIPAIALMGGGALVLIVSAVTYGLSRQALSTCTETPSQWLCPDQATASNASLFNQLTTGGLIVGGVLLVGGGLLAVVMRATSDAPHAARRRAPTFTAWMVPGSGGIGVAGAF